MSVAHLLCVLQGRETDGSGPSGAEPVADPELEAARKVERERRTAKVRFRELAAGGVLKYTMRAAWGDPCVPLCCTCQDYRSGIVKKVMQFPLLCTVHGEGCHSL